MGLLTLERLLNARLNYNLIFVSDHDLFAFVKAPQETVEKKSCCLAELFIRRYLNPKRIPCVELDAILTHEERITLEAHLYERIECTPEDVAAPLWKAEDQTSHIYELAVRARFQELFDPARTCGFIPVYKEGTPDAFFLPFHFEKTAENPRICDAAGKQIDAWQSDYAALNLQENCIVHCFQNGIPELKGNSFMLPVFLAAKRNHDPEFPAYNRLRLLATGAISDHHLVPVSTEEKANAASRIFQESVFLFPESSSYYSEKGNECALPCTKLMDGVMEEIRRIIESKNLNNPDFTYAMKRLEKIEFETRHETVSRWEELLSILSNNARSVSCWRSPHGYLLCLMLRSAICCHMGRTYDALKWNLEAKKYAEKNGFEKQLLRLEIEELVELQDLEDFSAIQRLQHTLGENIDQFGDDDLRMRYHGTMGQAHAFGFLSGLNDFSKDESLLHFQKAVQYAFRLNSNEDAAQDLNYLHLWHALFVPGSAEENNAWQEAMNHINCNLKPKSPASCSKNLYFLRKQRAFAAYRKLLNDGVFSGNPEEIQRLLLPEHEVESWMFSVTNKYIGAVTAAAGDVESAARYFQSALEKLPKSPYNPIISFIRMTILAEAYRSLKKEEYRTKALAAAESLQSVYPESIVKWKDFLNGTGSFPGLNYWY